MKEEQLTMNDDIQKRMQAHLDNLTKPRGSLGKLEDYALKMAKIQNKVPPEIRKVDRGTGIDTVMLKNKKRIITEAVLRRNPAKNAMSIMEQVGAFDLAMMTGLVLGLRAKALPACLTVFR
jgi:NaMN:DMB phosphoribosyltransferase